MLFTELFNSPKQKNKINKLRKDYEYMENHEEIPIQNLELNDVNSNIKLMFQFTKDNGKTFRSLKFYTYDQYFIILNFNLDINKNYQKQNNEFYFSNFVENDSIFRTSQIFNKFLDENVEIYKQNEFDVPSFLEDFDVTNIEYIVKLFYFVKADEIEFQNFMLNYYRSFTEPILDDDNESINENEDEDKLIKSNYKSADKDD
jgi:hypothetical protein